MCEKFVLKYRSWQTSDNLEVLWRELCYSDFIGSAMLDNHSSEDCFLSVVTPRSTSHLNSVANKSVRNFSTILAIW